MRMLSVLMLALPLLAADPPTAEIGNGKIRAKVYLPDAANGFYRGTRFDWSGVIFHLEAGGHSYYAPWFTKRNPAIRDFVYEGDDIVAGACSSTAGPADEFRPIGFDAAKPGETFLKIGVGLLRRPDEKPYDGYRLYEIADAGKWTVRRKADSITFTQTVGPYIYTKSLVLTKGKAEMVMHHTLKNTGAQRLETTVYNHNFLVMDGKGPGTGTVVTFPFAIQTQRPPNAELAEIQGNRLVYKKDLAGKDTVFFQVGGFGSSVTDHSIRVENAARKAGMSIQGSQPLQSVNLWSIRSNVSVEPFITVSVEPGKEFRWTSTYSYYPLP